jgi:hypothetical protein
MSNFDCTPDTLGSFTKFIITAVVLIFAQLTDFIEHNTVIIDTIVKVFQMGAYSGTAIMGWIAGYKYYKEKIKG